MRPPAPSYIFVSLFAAILLVLPTVATAASSEQIYSWVAKEMGIPDSHVLPQVHYVSKQGLGEALRKSSQASFKRWELEYGTERAESFMNTYVTGIVGLYDVHANTVYVGDFLQGCRREAILAHEFAHAMQLATEGPVGDDGPAVALVQMFREKQAQAIERRYAGQCSRWNIP